MERIGLKAI